MVSEREAGQAFVERFAGTLARSGWPRMSARIFATLMITATGSATSADLARTLDVGPSAISNGAKMLHHLAVVDTRRLPDRRLVYEVRPDAWVEAILGQDSQLTGLEQLLRQGAAALDTTDAVQRLTETADFFAFLRQQLPQLVQQWKNTREHGAGSE